MSFVPLINYVEGLRVITVPEYVHKSVFVFAVNNGGYGVSMKRTSAIS